MPSVVLLNGPRSLERGTAANRLLKRCLLESSSLAHNVVSISGRRPNTGQLRLRVVRVTHGSYGTRLTKSSSRRLHPSSHSVLVIWRCTSLVRSTRSASTLRQRPHHVSYTASVLPSFYVSAGDYGGDIAGTVQALRFGSGADLACETCQGRTSTSHCRCL